MVRGVGMPQDHAIEAVVVVKLREHREVQPGGIHGGNGGQMVRRSGDAQDNLSVHRFASFADGSMPWLYSLLLLLELQCHRSGTGLAVLELSFRLGKVVAVCRNP